VTTISLCDSSWKVAQNLDNLSKFVRTALLVHSGDRESMHTMGKVRRTNRGYVILVDAITVEDPKTGKLTMFRMVDLHTHRCDPFSKKGQCSVCWSPMDGPIEKQVAAVRARLEGEWLEALSKEYGRVEE